MTTFNNIIETAKANGLKVETTERANGLMEYTIKLNYLDNREDSTDVSYDFIDGKTEVQISINKYSYQKIYDKCFEGALKHLKRMLKK